MTAAKHKEGGLISEDQAKHLTSELVDLVSEYRYQRRVNPPYEGDIKEKRVGVSNLIKEISKELRGEVCPGLRP